MRAALSPTGRALLIRAWHRGGITQQALAQRFGISQPTVSRLVHLPIPLYRPHTIAAMGRPEPMQPVDFSTFSNTELIPLVDLPADQDGLRYYIPKAEKLELLTTEVAPERLATILAAARKKQQDHHAYLRTRRTVGATDPAAQVEAKLAGASWRYLEHVDIPDGFRDACTGRAGKIAYVIQNQATGQRIKVTRATVEQAHQQLRNIQAWPPPRGRRAAKEAGVAGVITAAHLRKQTD